MSLQPKKDTGGLVKAEAVASAVRSRLRDRITHR
jgi:hypothetical protein